VSNISREDGFTLTEMLVSTTIMLLVMGGALTTFRNALTINDSASQLADANQNLRAGTNQLIKDLMMAGRIIGAEGIAMPTGAGVVAFGRPGPVGSALTFPLIVDDDTTLNLPSLATGYQLGPVIDGSPTDMVTIMTVDEFMPTITTPPPSPAVSPPTEGTIAPDYTSVTLANTSLWLLGDSVNDTPAIMVGDLILFKGPSGNAILTVTSKDATHLYFAGNDTTNDPFHFNQHSAPIRPLAIMKGLGANDNTSPWPSTSPVTLFRALMITYYVDNTTTPGTPRLTRMVNHFAPQALAGVVEDLDLTYDLVDGAVNPTNVTSLPYTVTNPAPAVTYNSNQIRKVNIHVGVRSEVLSKPSQDYVRNHISTSVDVRSLASVDRYKTQ
jgi:prepilin-type N-terminal cleavage/methylation domain-containing protein